MEEQLPAHRLGVHLNTGACGPLPLCVHQALAQAMVVEVERGRSDHNDIVRFKGKLAILRETLARLIGATPDEMAITQNTTDGLNHVVWGLDWQPGDRVVTTSLEHLGGLAGLYAVSGAHQVEVICYDPPLGTFDLDAFWELCTDRTRMIVISHASWLTGLVLPIRELCRRAKERGILVAVDGAQAAGVIPVDVQALGVDAYSFPSHKWLLGPEGLGGLYVRSDVLPRLRSSFVGKFSFAEHGGKMAFVPHHGAQRFETGTRYKPLVDGWLAGLQWLEQEIGWPFIFEIIQNRRAWLVQHLQEDLSVTPYQAQESTGLIAFDLPECGCAPEQVVQELAAQRIFIRGIPRTRLLRASVGFFHAPEDLSRFVEALEVSFSKERGVRR